MQGIFFKFLYSYTKKDRNYKNSYLLYHYKYLYFLIYKPITFTFNNLAILQDSPSDIVNPSKIKTCANLHKSL